MARSFEGAVLVVAGAALLTAAPAAHADSLSRGNVSLQARSFQPDDVEDTQDNGLALTTQLEINHDLTRNIDVILRGLARLDALDDTRNVAAVEDASAAITAGRFTLRLGFQVVNWSATEAFHPADILNSRNYDSDAENPEKFGEPMIEARLRFLAGHISVFFMPARLPPKLPDARSRLSPLSANSAGLDLGDALWVNRDGKQSDSYFAPQAAVNVSQTFGKTDISVHLVDHNDRTHPTFTLDDSGSGLALPTYHTVTQVGFAGTQVIGSVVLKLEGAARRFYEPAEEGEGDLDIEKQANHGQVAGGIEYGWTTGGGGDATIILEGTALLLDDRQQAQLLDVAQGDVLIAYRHGFNDLRDRDLRLALVADVERPSEYIASTRYAQSITDVWSMVAIARAARILGKDIYEGEVTLLRNF